MQVQIDPSFIYPALFVISSRAAGASFPPGEVVGVLIVKQTIGSDGVTPLAQGQQQAINLKDVTYEPYPPADPGTTLAIKLEADLVSSKPFLDVVAVRDNALKAFFGGIRIDRSAGFEPNPANRLDFGWLSRTNDPRKSLAGAGGSFVPDVNDKFKLPTGFRNQFLNGSPLRNSTGLNPVTPAHLQAGHRVEFGDASHRVTIPAGPSLNFQLNGAAINPPVTVDRHVDTVIFQQTQAVYLITWRAIFAWQERLADALLLVS